MNAATLTTGFNRQIVLVEFTRQPNRLRLCENGRTAGVVEAVSDKERAEALNAALKAWKAGGELPSPAEFHYVG